MKQTTTVTAPTVAIGANFTGSNIDVSGFFPPDSDGAIGPNQFVELVNGVYRVYDEAGNILQQSTLNDFWASAGVPQAAAFDPRILYDPESQRWYAAAMDYVGGTTNNTSAFLLAVSKTSDPTQGWQAFKLGQTFDFTELGINKDGVYLVGTDGSAGNIDFVSIPKSDLLGTTPTIANASFFTTFFGNTGPAPQPAIAPALTGSEAILGLGPDFLKISSIDSPTTSPVLNTQGRSIIVPDGFQVGTGATQEGSTIPVDTGNLVFSSSVVIEGDKLFGVETVAQSADQGHPGLRWFEIGNPFTAPVVLDSGIISPPGLDVYYGSIAVNPLGEVVIGFSGSGPNDYPSAYAVAGTLNGDVLQFGAPILLKAGVAPETSGRFGDYSTTTFDPTDPSHFWTIQEWTSASGWSTQISEIIFTSEGPPTPSGPVVTSVETSGNGITAGTGDLNVGAVVTLTLHLSEAVSVVGGTPTLLLNDGGVATYAGGSGSDALIFSYTVAAGQNTADLAVTSVDLNGAIVVASPPTIAPGSGQSLTDANGHVFTFGGAYQGGDYFILRDGAVDGSGATLVLVNGVVFDHTTSFGWYADSAGQFIYQQTAPVLNSAADLSGAVTNPAGILQIDTIGTPSGPAVTSVETSGNGITAGTGDLNVGAIVTLTLHLSEPVSVVGGVPTLLLNDGGVATYAGGSGSAALIFSYTVAAGQNTPDLAVTSVDLNGAIVAASPSTIVPGSGQSLTDANGHVFTFGGAYQGGDYFILRDGAVDGSGAALVLVDGVVFDHTTSFGWFADSAGQFIYQQTAPVLNSAADLSGAVTNPAGILQIDTTVIPVAGGQTLTYLVKIDGVAGDSTLKGYTDYLAVDEFTFGELTQLSGSTGAGAGKPQLDPLVVGLAHEPAGLATLLKDAAAGSHIAKLDLVGLSTAGNQTSQVYDLKLSNVTVAGIAIDGGHDTAVAFNYASGSETIKGQNQDGSLDAGQTATFGASTTAVNHDALASFAHAHSGAALTYLVKIDGVAGDSTLKGYTDYLAVDEFTFGELTQLSGSTGAGTGKPQLDPLVVDLAHEPAGLATLLKDAAAGSHIAKLDLVGLSTAGNQTSQVYDLKLSNVTVAGIAIDGGHDTAVAFNYASGSETIKGQNQDGSLDAGQTATFGASTTAVNHDALASFAHAHSGAALTYLVKIDGVAGDSTLKGYTDYLAVDEFTFGELTQLSGSTGAGAGKPQLDPLVVGLAHEPAGLATLLKDAAAGSHIAKLDLVGLSTAGNQTSQVYDLKLSNVTVAGIAIDGGHDTAVAFNYASGSETIKGQNQDGSLDAGQTATFGASTTAVNHDALASFAHAHSGAALTYLVKIDGVAGDSTLKGYTDYLAVDEFTFGELTQLSGSTGAGAGKPQLDPLVVDLAHEPAGLATLLKDAAAGSHIAKLDLVGLSTAGNQTSQVYDLKLSNVTVAGIAIDGGHDTAVAFNYASGSETIKGQNQDGSLDAGQTATFGASTTAVNHDALASFAHAHSGAALTYLVKIDGVAGDSTLKGYTDYLAVDEFTFGELTQLSGSTGAGAGKPQLDPLVVDLAHEPAGLATLLKDAAAGSHIAKLDLVGLSTAGNQTSQVYDLKLSNVTVAGIAIDGGHDTAVAFNYASGSETIKGQNQDGSLDAGQTATFGASTTAVNHDALASFAHAHSGAALTYLVKIDGVAGDSTLKGYTDYLAVDEFTFGELTQLSGSTGAGTGKPQLDPLVVDLAHEPAGLATLLKDAAAGSHIAKLDLVGLSTAGNQTSQVYDLKLSNVTVAGIAIDGGHDTAVAFNYASGSETIKGQNQDGSLDAGQTATFGASTTAVNHDALASFAHAHSDYLV